MEMSLQDKYIISRWCYSIGEEFISDAEYNNLHRMFKETGELPEYVNRSWSSDPCPVELLKKYGMEDKARHIIHSDKTDSIEAITTEYDLQLMYKNMEELHLVSYKEDGWNFQLTYHKNKLVHGQTRGRKADAIDVSGLLPIFPQDITIEDKCRVIGEMTLSNDNFKELKRRLPEKNLQSQRAAVRSAIANSNCWDLLSFHAFDVIVENKEPFPASYIYYLLGSWGFETPAYVAVQNYEQLVESIKNLSNSANYYPHLTDGLVVRSNDGRVLRAIRLLNWEEPIYRSYVEGYEEDVAAHTRPMKIKIFPIKLANSTQSTVPITNLGRIVKNRLEIGSPIAFKFTSASIADIEENVTSILQRTYEGKYKSYRELIEQEEYIKAENELR